MNGSLTTTELKKPYPSRLVGGAQTWNGLVQHPRGQKFGRDTSRMRSPRSTPGFQCLEYKSPQLPAQDSSARDISPHFWLQKPAGTELVEETTGAPSSSSMRTHTQTHLLRLIPSELQHQGSSLKGTSDRQGETEVSGIKASRGHCPFAKPSPNRASKLVINLANTVRPALEIPRGSVPPNLQTHPRSA